MRCHLGNYLSHDGSFVVSDGEYIYALARSKHEIIKLTNDSKTYETLHTFNIDTYKKLKFLCVDHTYLYYVLDDEIYRMNKDGSEPIGITKPAKGTVMYLYSVDNTLYYTIDTSNGYQIFEDHEGGYNPTKIISKKSKCIRQPIITPRVLLHAFKPNKADCEIEYSLLVKDGEKWKKARGVKQEDLSGVIYIDLEGNLYTTNSKWNYFTKAKKECFIGENWEADGCLDIDNLAALPIRWNSNGKIRGSVEGYTIMYTDDMSDINKGVKCLSLINQGTALNLSPESINYCDGWVYTYSYMENILNRYRINNIVRQELI